MLRTFRLLTVAFLSAAGASSALGQDSPVPRQVGPVSGDSEKDTIAFDVGGRGGCGVLQPHFSAEPRQIGPVLSDPEKDTVGYVLLRPAAAPDPSCGVMPRSPTGAASAGSVSNDP